MSSYFVALIDIHDPGRYEQYLAGFDAVIPLDEVIETMDRVGRSIPRELRCTGLGGLSAV